MEKKYRNISVFYGCIIMVYTMAEGLFGYGFTAFMYSRGMNLLYVGMLLGMTDLFTTIFDYPSGNFADKFGRKKICGMGFLIYGAGFCVFASSHSVWMFFLSCITRALGVSLISGAPTTWYLGELSKMELVKYKDRVLPIVRGLSLLFGSVSGILASGLAGYNMALPIYVGGFLLIIFGIFILCLFEDNMVEKVKEVNIVLLTVENTRKFIKDKTMRELVLFSICKAVPFAIFIVSWQIFATQTIGLETKALGFLYTLMLLLMSLTSFIVRYLLKRMKGSIVSIVGILFSSVGFIVFMFCNTVTVFCIGFIIYEIGLGILNASYHTWLYDFISEEVLSSHTSALSSIDSLVSFVMSFFIGGFIQLVGYGWGWGIAVVFEAFAIVCLVMISVRLSQEH